MNTLYVFIPIKKITWNSPSDVSWMIRPGARFRCFFTEPPKLEDIIVCLNTNLTVDIHDDIIHIYIMAIIYIYIYNDCILYIYTYIYTPYIQYLHIFIIYIYISHTYIYIYHHIHTYIHIYNIMYVYIYIYITDQQIISYCS